MEVKVEVSKDGKNYLQFNEYEGFQTEKEKELGLRLIYFSQCKIFSLVAKISRMGPFMGRSRVLGGS